MSELVSAISNEGGHVFLALNRGNGERDSKEGSQLLPAKIGGSGQWPRRSLGHRK